MKAKNTLTGKLRELGKDSGNAFLGLLEKIARQDVEVYAANLPFDLRVKLLAQALEDPAGLKKAHEAYGNSWKQRGGVGAFMMLARKWDRLEKRTEGHKWDVFETILKDQRREGAIDDVRDLRRYLMLVEAEMLARGFGRVHRDNATEPIKQERRSTMAKKPVKKKVTKKSSKKQSAEAKPTAAN